MKSHLYFFAALLLLISLSFRAAVATAEADRSVNELKSSSDPLGKKLLKGKLTDKFDFDDLEHSTSLADGLSSSFAMIIVSELGDETFIIAAIMAMRQNRTVVLAGALSALYVMTVLSTLLGFLVPNLVTKETTTQIATFLYIFFGLRLFYIGYNSTEDIDEEISEVEEKLKESRTLPMTNNGNGRNSMTFQQQIRSAFSIVFSALFLEAFVLTFSAEWGDRSQIATVVLASHKNPYAVTVGACLGHTVCTSIAVWGGRIIAKKISQRTVAFAGGLTFFAFAVYNVLVGINT